MKVGYTSVSCLTDILEKFQTFFDNCSILYRVQNEQKGILQQTLILIQWNLPRRWKWLYKIPTEEVYKFVKTEYMNYTYSDNEVDGNEY